MVGGNVEKGGGGNSSTLDTHSVMPYESVTGFSRFTHGEAVAWGIRCALELGSRLGLTDAAYAERITALLDAYGYPSTVDGGISPPALLEAMRMDKKKHRGQIRCMVQPRLGDTLLVCP